jgi:hypothetical protein
MNAPLILTVDAARVLGFAYGVAGGRPSSGVVTCAKADSSRGAVFSGAGRWVTAFLSSNPVDILAVEAPFHASIQINQKTADILLGLPAVIEFMAYQLGVYRHERINQSSVKKHFVGFGKGDQKAPIRRKCLALGWITPEEAEADTGFNRTDALALWSYAETRFAPKLSQPVDDLFVMAQRRNKEVA